tara:strand:- start:329 stop:472 length:144 start_codon:yes stop_codon:yes gene_type:complete
MTETNINETLIFKQIIIEKEKKIKILEEKLKLIYNFLKELENIHLDN